MNSSQSGSTAQSQKQLPHGSWPSPINTKLIVKDAIGIDEIQLYHDDVYWIEKRPTESGRCVIVQHKSDITVDVLPTGFSTR